MLIVLDTNALVSALLSPFGTPARVLDLVLIGDARLAFDDRISTEYREVLARPKFGFAPEDVRDLLDYLVITGEPVTPRLLAAELPDPADLPFLEVAVEAGAPLITGNAVHFEPAARSGIVLLTPRDFVTRWRNG